MMENAASTPSLIKVRERLDHIDKAAASVVAALDAHLDRFRQASLATIGGAERTMPKSPAAAASIYKLYRGAFKKDPIPADIDAGDRAALGRYLHAFVAARIRFTDLYGQTVAAVDPSGTRDVLQLCLVLRLLNSSDEAWSQADIDVLAAWMKPPPNLAALELFSLLCERPFTAYQFHLSQLSSPARKQMPARPSFDYLSAATDAVLQSNDFQAAVCCLDTAVRLSDAKGSTDQTNEFRLRLADVLQSDGRPNEAAEQARIVLSTPLTSSAYGYAKMSRIKYLFAAGRGKDLLGEAAEASKDDRCREYLPQIYYFAWAAARESSSSGEEELWSKAILSGFPNHPLAAEVYFAKAMEALAGNRRDEALRICRLILDQFPDAAVADPARRMVESLKDRSQ